MWINEEHPACTVRRSPIRGCIIVESRRSDMRQLVHIRRADLKSVSVGKRQFIAMHLSDWPTWARQIKGPTRREYEPPKGAGLKGDDHAD